MPQRCQSCNQDYPVEVYQSIFVTCPSCRKPDFVDHPTNRRFRDIDSRHPPSRWSGWEDNVTMSLDQTLDIDADIIRS